MKKIVVGVLLLLLAALLLPLMLGTPAPLESSDSPPADRRKEVSTRNERPKISLASSKPAPVNISREPQKKKIIYDPAKELAINNHPYMISVDDPDPRIQSVVEAHRSGKYPERLSVMHLPKAFDENAWERDEKYRFRYLSTIEPGRIYHIASPHSDAPKLGSITAERTALRTGEKVILTLEAPDGAPVNFLSPDGGIFIESRLNSATVVASGGEASITWYALPGTLGTASVLASSPFAKNKSYLSINVSEKQNQ